MMYDYLVVGAGPFGAVFAHEMRARGRSVLVLDRRSHVGGNLHCETRDGITIHRYGAHIFHTNDERVWQYVNRFVSFNHYVNSPVANYRGELYNLPFNMNTFHALWGVTTPDEAAAKIAAQRPPLDHEPRNLEEQALQLVGRDLYEKLVRGYTEKQWGRPCCELPPHLITRLPLRFTFDNNYFNARYQGIPVEGYNALIDKLLDGCDVRLRTDYLAHHSEYNHRARTVVYTGAIDAYFDYCCGELEYRSLRFDTRRCEVANRQGVAVMNYTDADTPYTRTIEHKHFALDTTLALPLTYVTCEYPARWTRDCEPYYPVGDAASRALYERYAALARRERGVIFGGRLAEYRYYDMDAVIARALQQASLED